MKAFFNKALSLAICAALVLGAAALSTGGSGTLTTPAAVENAAANTAESAARELATLTAAENTAPAGSMLEGVDTKGFTDLINAERTKYEGTVSSNRHVFEPVYVEIDGSEYNLLNPVEAITALSKADTENEKNCIYFTYLELGLTNILNCIAKPLPSVASIEKEADFVSENFMTGHRVFINEAPKSAVWKLGYSQCSLLPDDLLKGGKDYYLAGYLLQNLPSNTVETVLDDMKVRTIVLDDSTGRGKVAFSTIDCIGISNADIRDIRELLAKELEKYNLVSINVFSTHCHSTIDTLGLWNPFFLKMGNNFFAALTKDKLIKTIPGPDEDFMNTLKERTAQSIREACENMHAGEMYAAEKDGTKYMFDKRDPSLYETDITTLRFVPYSKSVQPTMILNMAGHPYITGLKTDNSSGKELSADFVYYTEEVVNKAGYNFMFFNGAILGVYTDRGQTNDGVEMARRSDQAERYGREIGYFIMSMTKSYDEILKADYVDWDTINAEKGAEGYTLWCENWKPVKEARVSPVLNIRLAEVELIVENPIIMAAGKLGLVNHNVYKGSDGYYKTITEIGYLEIGKDIKVCLMPGEYTQELISGGGVMDGENSFSGKDYGYPSLNEIVGDELICFGLANDELGYILPDNDYCMIFFDDVEPFGDHYQESIAFGRTIASDITVAFEKMYKDINK